MLLLTLAFFTVGLVAGIVGSILGIGGGMFFVPALLAFGNMFEPGSVTTQSAAATSLAVVCVTALSSTLAFLKQKKVDTNSALFFFLGVAPGSVAGVYVNSLIEAGSFYLLFGLFQLSMFALMMVKDKLKPRMSIWDVRRTYIDEQGIKNEYGYQRWSALLVAFCVGLTSSLFGIGGGILMVPVLIVLYCFPPHIATATTMFVIFLSALIGSATNVVHGNINWLYALLLASGAWAGGNLGAYVAARLKGRTLVVLLRILLLGICVQMIYKAFGA